MIDNMPRTISTAALSAGGLIAGYAVASGTGSRPLGGVVLLAVGAVCVWVWLSRDSVPTAAKLSGFGVLAFAFSHILGLLIGPWPAVLLVAAAMALACWRISDARARS